MSNVFPFRLCGKSTTSGHELRHRTFRGLHPSRTTSGLYHRMSWVPDGTTPDTGSLHVCVRHGENEGPRPSPSSTAIYSEGDPLVLPRKSQQRFVPSSPCTCEVSDVSSTGRSSEDSLVVPFHLLKINFRVLLVSVSPQRGEPYDCRGLPGSDVLVCSSLPSSGASLVLSVGHGSRGGPRSTVSPTGTRRVRDSRVRTGLEVGKVFIRTSES